MGNSKQGADQQMINLWGPSGTLELDRSLQLWCNSNIREALDEFMHELRIEVGFDFDQEISGATRTGSVRPPPDDVYLEAFVEWERPHLTGNEPCLWRKQFSLKKLIHNEIWLRRGVDDDAHIAKSLQSLANALRSLAESVELTEADECDAAVKCAHGNTVGLEVCDECTKAEKEWIDSGPRAPTRIENCGSS